jgi:hypothetical protein
VTLTAIERACRRIWYQVFTKVIPGFNSIHKKFKNPFQGKLTQIVVVMVRSMRVDGTILVHLIKVEGMLLEESGKEQGSERLREHRGSSAGPVHVSAGAIQKRISAKILSD